MLYLDTSAIVKKYVEESGSEDVRKMIADSTLSATAVISLAETAAAFAKAAKAGLLSETESRQCHTQFSREWKHYIRIRITEALIARADQLAWSSILRGYDAVHLAAALQWQEHIGESITLATFDRQLSQAASQNGLNVFPDSFDRM